MFSNILHARDLVNSAHMPLANPHLRHIRWMFQKLGTEMRKAKKKTSQAALATPKMFIWPVRDEVDDD